MTNQQGAPEALRHADGLESFAQMLPAYGFNPQPLKDAAATVRSLHALALELADQLSGKNERLAALVEAQQPATSAAAAPSVSDGQRALHEAILNRLSHAELLEKAHYLMELNSNQARTIGELQDLVEAAPQPSPTPQTDSAPTSGNWVSADDVNRLVRELDVALNGEAGAAAQASLCDVVAQVRLEASKRNQPLLAPQADSQPAPVVDYPPLPARRRAFLCTKCGGRECEPETLNKTHPSCKCGYLGFAEDLDFTADDMRAYVDADRAARAPADSVTASAGGVVDGWKLAPKEPTLHMGWAYLDAAKESDPLRTHTFNHAGYRAMLAAVPTPPTQAAGSVLEDAARWQALESRVLEINGGKDWMSIVLKDDAKPEPFLKGMLADKLAALAARKQGGA